MSAYMISVLVCAAVTALVRIMLPDDSSTGRYVKYISGLVSLSVIASPLLAAIKNPGTLPELPELQTDGEYGYDYGFGEKIVSEAERAVAAEIESGLRGRFGFGTDELSVSVVIESEDPADLRISKITVTLARYGAWSDPSAVRRFISETYDKNAEVEIRYE